MATWHQTPILGREEVCRSGDWHLLMVRAVKDGWALILALTASDQPLVVSCHDITAVDFGKRRAVETTFRVDRAPAQTETWRYNNGGYQAPKDSQLWSQLLTATQVAMRIDGEDGVFSTRGADRLAEFLNLYCPPGTPAANAAAMALQRSPE